MWGTDTPQAKRLLGISWVAFAVAATVAMYLLPGRETVPYFLIWVSFGFVYGVMPWPRALTWSIFAALMMITSAVLGAHLITGQIEWDDSLAIVPMVAIAALLVWHVDRHRTAEDRVRALREAELVRAQNRDLTTRVGSHELRTRLTIARGFAELIRDGHDLPEQVRADADIVLEELDKATALTEEILTLVRADAVPAQVDVDVAALVDRVARRWRARSDRAWSSQAPAATIIGDANRLETALDCVIENAVRFTQPGDAISITAALDGDELVLTVQDTGRGIAPADLDHVFELFRTGSDAGELAGSGLGLAIVKTIMDGLGGRCRAISAPGSGARLELRCPRRPDRLQVAGSAQVAGNAQDPADRVVGRTGDAKESSQGPAPHEPAAGGG